MSKNHNKKQNNKPEEVEEIESNETKSPESKAENEHEEEEEAEEVVVTKPVKETIVRAVGSTEREVKIKGLVDHKCTIANEVYILQKGKEQRVPASVALVLAGAGKALTYG